VHEEEQVLAGGNLTRVVRVGSTVRRTAGEWTPMVHDLLDHLRGTHFDLAPEPLGIDEQGREILSYLPGETVTDRPWPRWLWHDDLLVQAAEALARYHHAVAGYRPGVVSSRLGTTVLGPGDVVCHNDFAPYNCTFSSGRLTGVFDWDLVCAAPPLHDLAQLAWQWLPLHAPCEELAWRTPHGTARRLRLLLEAYGADDSCRLDGAGGFVEAVIDRVEATRSGILQRAADGEEVFRRLEREGHTEEMARAVDFIRSVQPALEQALVRP
jgi:hypothetical protein